jgi:hypothetical protein
MKTILKAIFSVVVLLMLGQAYGQGSKAKEPVKQTTRSNTSIAIQLKNRCEKDVIIFVGRRDELKNPKAKQKVYGGLSTNTIYASINEVVCIITPQEKATSCTNVKAGITEMEVNSSGTVITSK